MTSFETITLDDYKKLVANEKKIFDLTENFTTSEILNKYRHTDKNIEDKIKQNEIKKEKYENLDKIINKIKENSANNIINNYYPNVNDEVEDEKYMKYINKEMNDNIINSYEEEEYNFDNDDSILDSFSKIYEKYGIKYKPQKNKKFIRVRYLLQKLKDNEDIDRNLYNHFQTSLSERNKLYHKIPTYEEEYQEGSSINNIIINNKDLNNGILRVRYLNNNRKLTNNLLKHDYKISKNMVNAIRFNKDLHKLSKNELKIYHELQKFLNKEQDINVLIGSYLSGNNSKKLYNKISSILYHKLKNNIISKREYTKLINKINKI